ncbi:hypothetical protein QC589_00700 [Halomonas elongata]|uniref:hypothetical protein n=1 Tax=Halomonas elongata TaxID=2746 RepID=UPI003346287B
MPLSDILGIAMCLLMLGGVVMTQLEGGLGTWLLVSWVGIPAFFLLAGLLANSHGLLFGAAVMIGVYAFRRA